jgi:hypothetical protein
MAKWEVPHAQSGEGGGGESDHLAGQFKEGLVDVGVVGSRDLEEVESQFASAGLSFFGCNFLGVLVLALGGHEHSSESAFVVELLDLVKPLEAVLETVLVGAIVDHHHQVRPLAHAQGDRLVELVAAEVEEEELDREVFVGLGDHFGEHFGPLGLARSGSTML